MDIERKYNRGAKIILFISIIVIPMQLLTSALISRISAEASGTLGLIEIFYNGIIAFFMLGGETGIIKLLTDRVDFAKKKSFILKYAFICVVFFLIATLGLRIFNIDIIQNMVGQEKSTSVLMYVVALFVIMNNILLAYIKESERFIHYAIGIKLFNLGNLLAVLYSYFIARDSNTEIVLLVSLGTIQLLNILYIVIKEKIFYKVKWKSEDKFNFQMIKYLFFLYLSTILVFVHDKIDQIIVVNKLGLSILGGYYLIIKVVNMVKLIPNTYNSTFYPYICKQLKKENSNFIFNNILSKNLLFIFPLVVIVILNCNLIITILFGAEYIQYSLLLQILTSIILFSAPNIILNNFLYALEKSNKYFPISLISVLIESALIYSFIDKCGLIIVTVAKACNSFIVLILCKRYLKKIEYETKLPLNYYLYNAIVIFLLILTNVVPMNKIICIIITIIILAIFAIQNRQYVLNILKHRKEKICDENKG